MFCVSASPRLLAVVHRMAASRYQIRWKSISHYISKWRFLHPLRRTESFDYKAQPTIIGTDSGSTNMIS